MTVYEQLLVVQEHDTHADQLRHRLDTLPEKPAVTAAEAAVAAIDARIAEVTVRRDELARSQKRLEDEIATVEDKRAHEEATLYSGSVTSPRELQALQDEVDALKRRTSSLEDEEIEIMELLEPVDAELAELASQRDAAEASLAEARAALSAASGGVDAELVEVLAQRDAAAAAVEDAALLAEYERLRPQMAGVAIARLVGTTCGGCHLSLSAVEADRIRKLPPDARATCDECGRMLVR